jgi:cytochrome c-type biogenesis protein CcmH
MFMLLALLAGFFVVAFLLWPLRQTPRPNLLSLGIVAILVVLSLAGYVRAGKPQALTRVIPAAVPVVETRADIEQARRVLLEDPGNIAAWSAMATGLQETGHPDDALEALSVASKAMPRSADLWVARGQLLVRRADGEITPAARLAFDRAAQIDPSHPAPRYMLALAWVMQGKPQDALPILQALERDTPKDAAYRENVERLLLGVQSMIAAGVGSSASLPD